jgi:hypothetical protein
MLIIPSSWGSQLGALTPHHQAFFWRRCREKEDFCKGSLSRSTFYFVIVLLYFIFTCIILSKIQKI